MTQKELAIKCLEPLDIYKPYIRKFKSKAGIPCFFENFAGFFADQEAELWNKIKEIEAEYECLVYAITHEISELGETWSMLCVPNHAASIEDCLVRFSNNKYYAYSWVWCKNSYGSEFGDVVVQHAFGGIRRVY